MQLRMRRGRGFRFETIAGRALLASAAKHFGESNSVSRRLRHAAACYCRFLFFHSVMHPPRPPQDLVYAVLAAQLGLISLDDAKRALSSESPSGSEPNVRELLLASQRITPEHDKLVSQLTDAFPVLHRGVTQKSLTLL